MLPNGVVRTGQISSTSDHSQITFAIPFHAGPDYLRRAIGSLLAQRDSTWTAFVCDNASTEPGIEDRVRAWGEGRVGYVRNPTNLGMAGNFNRCIDLADTELVTLLHADDELEPDYCETLRAAADRHRGAAAVFCHANIIGPDSEPWFSLADVVKQFVDPATRREVVLEGEPGIRALLKANFIMAPTLCFRKAVLGAHRFPEGLKFILDWELTTKLLLDGESLVGLPDRCYRYRRHHESATEELGRSQLRFSEESAYYNRMLEIVRARGWEECTRLATQKRMLKLNMAYRALKSVALCQFGDAGQRFRLLRDL